MEASYDPVYGSPAALSRGTVVITVEKRWIPSKYARSPLEPAAAGSSMGYIHESRRQAQCKMPELVYEPAAVAFLLTHNLGVAHASWVHKHDSQKTYYAMRLE